jgi:DNA-binding NarL/FixJ family response regulator
VRVLVVDDSPPVRARLASMVREVVGVLAVAEAADGDEAIVVARAEKPDLVVLDIHMPGTNGFDALPRLKELEPAPIVMVVTNDPSDRHRRRCLLLGADLFFDKSSHFDRALDLIAELVRERTSRTPRSV